jgi:hypothetical protein
VKVKAWAVDHKINLRLAGNLPTVDKATVNNLHRKRLMPVKI